MSDLEPDTQRRETFQFEDDGTIPNSRLPILLLRGVFAPAAELADHMQALFAKHDWKNAWRDGIFDYTHFHSNTHEILGVAAGSARVQLGGDKGQTIEIATGDILVLPAGTGHRCLEASADLLVVGAYPGGRDFDIRRGAPDERDNVLANLARVHRPRTDPIGGQSGPLLDLWGPA